MAEATRPNILLIMSDQHHAGFMGCTGEPIVRTPRLDALAAAGTRFENTYCPFPLCGPSRMAFMTGRHCHEIEVWTNDRQLHGDTPTFAHAFAAAGYRTVLSGRMHFVGPDQRHGFHQRLIGDVPESGHIEAGWRLGRVLGELRDTPGCSLSGVVKSGPGPTGYQAYDEAVGAATERWLAERAGQAPAEPFLLVAGLVLPHCPFVAPRPLFDHYARQITLDDLPPEDPNLHPCMAAWRRSTGVDPAPDREAQWRSRVAYHALCEQVDTIVGRLLDTLDRTGLADNTIVVYTSDHGEMLGEHGLWWKSSFYDGASRVPLVVRGPGVGGGRVVPGKVSLIDIGPTLLELAGAPGLPGASGRSFAPLLRGDDPAWPDTVFVEYADRSSASRGVQACRLVRRGPWKYGYYHGMGAELFNVETDPGELVNRIDDPGCAAIAAELRALVLRDWDPEQTIRRLGGVAAEHRLIAAWLRQQDQIGELLEPDPVWFGESPPANGLEQVSYRDYHPEG